MPIYTSPDTKKALGGVSLKHCESRSLLKDKFVFIDPSFDEDKQVALNTYVSNGANDLQKLRAEWDFNKSKQVKKKNEGDKYNENVLNKSTSALEETKDLVTSTEPASITPSNWLANIPDAKKSIFELSTSSRLLVGLANGVLENAGCTLHHRFGFPVIPGSALKGVARNAAEILKYDELSILEIFGSSSDDDTQSKGCIAFIPAQATLTDNQYDTELDILTPHFTEYYSGKNNPNALDNEQPVPNVFPSICPNVKFLFSLVCLESRIPTTKSKELLDLATAALTYALKHLGVGAKVNAGYGRFCDSKIYTESQDLFPPPVLSEEEEFTNTWENRTGEMSLKRFIPALSEIKDDTLAKKLFNQLIPDKELKNFRLKNPYWKAFLKVEQGQSILTRINHPLSE